MLNRLKIFWKLSAAFIIVILLFLVILEYLAALDIPALGTEGSGATINVRLILSILIAIAVSFILAWLFTKLFIKPSVDKLEDGMNRLANKEFDFRLEEDEKDEFDALSSSFNDMADMLASSLNELKKNRDYLEGIVESSADIIITVNASDKIQTINVGAENVLGYKRMDVIGKPVEMLFADPNDRRAAIDKLRFTDSVVNYETQFVTKDGRVKDVLLTLSRLHNPSGEVIGTIGISKDITELKRLQDQLIKSQRFAAIGQVFTGIQHSMKNMLNACKGGAYMVKVGLAKDDKKMLTEGWDIVQQGITSLTNMSMDMLKYVKEWKPKFSEADLIQLLCEIQRVIKPTARDQGVQIRLDVSNQLPHVVCDPRMIHSSVMDIVSNAIDACLWKEFSGGEKPEVVISAYLTNKGREAVIEVKDNGCGMTREVKENIFTPFFSTKSKAGTGLGLAITMRMIEVHNGKIDLDSEPDRGTIFRIHLPIDGTNQIKEEIDGKASISS
ncbi:MAG: PAS domain S-box protein [candidate division Zixibacteria bacterium]|nr:PAS domain S-box protein [candidate division Zixibacteria bacterium]NIR67854.1 PAS domain S-box protein [candidate division Zixibacteria bacterium]NIS15550.1 PAS domain S-box protein [candidate division Zixibacteria bacterium]NIS49080.1 PAS domain S-box protein [candidate division Zixibacteria bacterium]NIT52075.1 PAS domain S-box protein [candidate division Zixibacteria bacterium]